MLGRFAYPQSPDPREPIMSRWWFIALFSLYAASLQQMVLVTSPLQGEVLLPVRIQGEVYLSVGYFLFTATIFFLLCLLGRSRWREGCFLTSYEIGSVFVLFSFIVLPVAIVSWPKRSDPVSLQLLFVVIVEALLLTMIFAKSLDRVLLDTHATLDTIDDKVEYLKLDMTNYYRFSQLVATFFFVFGVGIAASLFPSSGDFGTNKILVHALGSGIGVIYLILYFLWKMISVRREIQILYMSR